MQQIAHIAQHRAAAFNRASQSARRLVSISQQLGATSRTTRPVLATMAYKYVVLGGGNASGYVAKEFVAQGLSAGELCILTEEPVVAYERPALSKGYLLGAAKLPGFHTCVGGGGERQEPDWYTSKGITYKVNSKVTSVDVPAKSLTLASGEQIKWTDALIIATGARPVRLTDFKMEGGDLPGVLYLRDVEDGAKLLTALADVKEKKGQVVCIGGGYIGMETAAGVASQGVDTSVIMPEDRLLARLLTPKLAEFYEKFYESKGIKLIKNVRATRVLGEGGKVTGVEVKLADGSTQTLPASLVVAGVGARPNTELFTGQLDTAPAPVGGIKVDGHFRTNVPGVYAIGDVAAFPLLRAGGALARQEHVTHARSSAAHAVKAILGKAEAPYDYLPYFYSRVFNLSWQFWGSQGDANTQVVHFGDVASGKFGAYWVSGGKVIGVFLESASPDEANAAKKVALEQPPAPADLETQGLAFATARL